MKRKRRASARKSWADPVVKAARIAKVLATRATTLSYRRNDEKLKVMRQMLGSGATCQAVGTVIGESGSYVWQWAKDEGIKTLSRGEFMKRRMADPEIRRQLSIAVKQAKRRR